MSTTIAPTATVARDFTAMGTTCRVVVVGGDDAHLDLARSRVAADEARWSRFQPTSDVSRITAGAGRRVTVDAATVALVALAVRAHRTTGGRFHPLLGHQLVALGYDRTFAEIDRPAVSTTTPGGDVDIDVDRGGVRIPPGAALDLGGIAKGHAADRAVTAVLAAGATGALVDLGGDVAVGGQAPERTGWWCTVRHGPDAPAPAVGRHMVGVAHGGIATSTVARRRWTVADGTTHHHLVDPATGASATSAWDHATVVAADAATAEVLATALLLCGDAADRRDLLGAHAAAGLVSAPGHLERLGPIDRFVADVPEVRP